MKSLIALAITIFSILSSNTSFACGEGPMNLPVGVWIESIAKTEDGPKVQVTYYGPKHNGFLQFFPVSVKWKYRQTCIDSVDGRKLLLQIGANTASGIYCGGAPTFSSVSVSRSTKTLYFDNTDLCSGMHYDQIAVNALYDRL